MRFIAETETEALRAHLAKRLQGPVTLDLFVEPESVSLEPGGSSCELCKETRELLEDVASLSDQITLHVHDISAASELARDMGVTRVPTLVLRGAARGAVRFLGIPAGLEFATLLGDLATVSGGTTSLRDQTRAKLATLTRPVHVQVFITPTCPYCPRVASLAHQAAVESAHVTADVIEVGEFPDLAEQYSVHGVPKIVINENTVLFGAQTEAAFVEAMLGAATAGAGESTTKLS